MSNELSYALLLDDVKGYRKLPAFGYMLARLDSTSYLEKLSLCNFISKAKVSIYPLE